VTERADRAPPIADEKLAIEISVAWVAAVRYRFDARFSREWLEKAIRYELRNGDSLAFAVKAVEAADRGDEIADAALREVGSELMERRSGRLGEGQILAYYQRAGLQAPHGRAPGRAWYDQYQRNLGICVMIKLACRVFGVHATRSLKGGRPNRPQSGVSLITVALARNRIHIEEKTIQKHIWFGVPGYLVKRVRDEEALVDFTNRWAQAAPFLQDLTPR
jgi:hypothetical protein